MQPPDLLAAKRVLAVAPHPDDIEIGIGGTVALMAHRGARIEFLTLSDGAAGTGDLALAGSSLAKQRREEGERAGRLLGVQDFHWLGLPDTQLAHVSHLAERVVQVIRAAKPDVVLTVDPWMPYEVHPDHRAAGFAVAEAFSMCGFAHYGSTALREGAPPHAVDAIGFYATNRPNTKVDVDDWLDAKLAAILAHESQFSGEEAEFVKAVTRLLAEQATGETVRVTTPSEPIRYAELIKVLSARQSHYNPMAERM